MARRSRLVNINRTASLRDFSGGWNVADNPYNLASKFLPVADNVNIGVDGAISPRFGYELFCDLKTGTTTSFTNYACTFATTSGAPKIVVVRAGHGRTTGDHLTISGAVASFGGIPASDINGTHGIRVIDANTFEFYPRTTATSTVSATAQTITSAIFDNHVLGGNILEMAFFQNNIVVFSDIGEIVAINSTATATRIWSNEIAATRSGAPVGWRKCEHVSTDTFKQTLICVNGRANDKPVEINFNRANIVEFLVDPATSSNANVPRGDFVQSAGGYVLIYATDNVSGPQATPTFVDISAANTSGVFFGNPAPDDALQLDLGRISNTIEPRITGVGALRDQVFVAFYDSGMLGTLGIYSGSVHEPEFKDQIPQHGALNHRVIINIGNDILMADYAGVPAFIQSIQSAVIVPERFSQLIDPELNKHFARLSQNTLRYKVFATYNVRDRQYMLFVPKYDSNSIKTAGTDPIFTVVSASGEAEVLLYLVNHGLSAGDFVDVSGAVGFSGLASGDINGRREVLAVLDNNYFVMAVGAMPTITGQSGGGSSVVIAPVNDETIGYVFSYNPQMRIKRWTRFRDVFFSAGTVSQEGRVFFGHSAKIYLFGTQDRPLYADRLKDYDATWAPTTAYTVGQLIKSSLNSNIYECLVAHTSGATSLEADFAADDDKWIISTGKAIDWEAESPWSDMGNRTAIKKNQTLTVDAQGTGRFNLQVFTDSIYYDPESRIRTPYSEVDLVGQDSPGFGAGAQPYGGGRRVKEQFLYHLPFIGKLIKIRMSGSTKEPLRVIALHLSYQSGSMYS